MALVEGADILEARVLIDGVTLAGQVISARLMGTGRNTIARDEAGNEYLLPNGAGTASEGAAVDIVVTRSAIPGAEPWKRALAKIAGEESGLSDPVAWRAGSLPTSWNDLIEEARSGIVRFAGGELRISPTPAMTLIDVDGWLPARELAAVGAQQAARAIRRLDIGGSVGIDLPTSGSKASRQAAAAEIDAILPQPFERTAVNGFGFVQIVRPRRRASLIELAQGPASFEARDLLRRTAIEPPGPKRLVAHPQLIALLESKPDWLDALSRQIGGRVSLREDPVLPIYAGHAEPA